jgi:fatty acid desaturase
MTVLYYRESAVRPEERRDGAPDWSADVDSQLKLGVPLGHREALVRLKFPMDRLRALMRIRPWRSVMDLAATGTVLVAGPLLYFFVPNPFTFGVCFVLSIRTFNCLAQLVHTSDHGGLFPNPRLNKFVGNLCAYCLGYTQAGHRLTHLNHHLYLNTERDPDLIWGRPADSSYQLFRMWMRDLILVSALSRLLQYSQHDRTSYRVAPWRTLTLRDLLTAVGKMWPVAVAQGLIFLWFTAILGPVYYLLLWVLPITTLYPAQIRLRSTVEHSFDVGYRPAAPQDGWIVRTTIGNLLERWVIAPFGTQHHFEHHLFPAIPHYNLAEVHRLLVRCGFSVPTASGYVVFAIRKFHAERKLAVTAASSA